MVSFIRLSRRAASVFTLAVVNTIAVGVGVTIFIAVSIQSVSGHGIDNRADGPECGVNRLCISLCVQAVHLQSNKIVGDVA